jgi:hypothetical protein
MTKMTTEQLIPTFIEIELTDSDAFLKIKETLTRIGISNFAKNKLTQTSHILQKRGKYYIVHFLQLFLLDGKEANYTKDDQARVVAIAKMLEDWGLCKIISKLDTSISTSGHGLTVIDYKAKQNWELSSKYTFGKNK